MSLSFNAYLLISEVLDANTEELLKKYQHFDPAAHGGTEAAEKAKQDFIKKLMDDPQKYDKADAFKKLQQEFPSIKRKPALRSSLIKASVKPELEKYKDMLAKKEITVPMYKTLKYFADKGVSELELETFIAEIKEAEQNNDLRLFFKDIPELVKVYQAEAGGARYKNIGKFENWHDFTTNLHANLAPKKSSIYADPEVLWKTYPENRVMKKNGIYVFKAFNFKQCRILGKGQSWCISNWPSYYLSYRHNKGQSQYFIFDTNKSPDDPARYVKPGVADPTKHWHSSEWVDARNHPDNINGYKSVEDYIDYLESKGFPKSLWTADPLTPAEIKAEEFVRTINYSSMGKWFEMLKDKEVADNVLTLLDHIPMDVFKALDEQQKMQFLSGKEAFNNYEIQEYLENLPLNTLRSYVRTLIPHGFSVDTTSMGPKLSKAFGLEYDANYYKLISPDTWEVMSPQNKEKYLDGLHIGGATTNLLRKFTPEERTKVLDASLQDRNNLDSADFRKIYEKGFTDLVDQYLDYGNPLPEDQFLTIAEDPDLIERYFKARIEKNQDLSPLTHVLKGYNLTPQETNWLIENDRFDILKDRIGHHDSLHPENFKKIADKPEIATKYIEKVLKQGRKLTNAEVDYVMDNNLLDDNWQALGKQIFLNSDQLEKLWNDKKISQDQKEFLVKELFKNKSGTAYGKAHQASLNSDDRKFMIKHNLWEPIAYLVMNSHDTPFTNAELDLMAQNPELLKRYLNARFMEFENYEKDGLHIINHVKPLMSNKEFELYNDRQKEYALNKAGESFKAILNRNFDDLDKIIKTKTGTNKEMFIKSLMHHAIQNEDKNLLRHLIFYHTKASTAVSYAYESKISSNMLLDAIANDASLDFIKFLAQHVNEDIDYVLAYLINKRGFNDVAEFLANEKPAGCQTYQVILDSEKIDDQKKKQLLVYLYNKDYRSGKAQLPQDDALEAVAKEIKHCALFPNFSNETAHGRVRSIPKIVQSYHQKIIKLKRAT